MRRKHPGLNRQVLVSLFSGNAVSGVLVSTPGRYLVLKGCQVHDEGASAPSPADGEIIIDTANVDYTQIVGG
jgi:small nuclear ribonucleoprotein (snRNP)-like protein